MSTEAINTDCKKCGEPMRAVGRVSGPWAHLPMTITAYSCGKCGHWNDMKKRGKRKVKQPMTTTPAAQPGNTKQIYRP
jgi:hypothetical protein